MRAGFDVAWRWLTASWAHVALVGGIPLTSWAHWQLAVFVDTPAWLAWCLPVGIDAYVLAAFLAWRADPGRREWDLIWALALDAVAVAGSHAVTLAPDLPVRWKVATAALLGVMQVLVLWRAHALDMRVKATRVRAQPDETRVSPAAEPTGLSLVPDDEPLTWLRAHAGEPVAAQAQALGLSPATVKRLRAQLRKERAA